MIFKFRVIVPVWGSKELWRNVDVKAGTLRLAYKKLGKMYPNAYKFEVIE